MDFLKNTKAELIATKNFNFDTKWISLKLKITETDVINMIANLVSLNLITIKNNIILKNFEFFALPGGEGNEKVFLLHENILLKAKHELRNQTHDNRDYSIIFTHIKKSDICEIKEKLKNFRRELIKEYETSESDSVYILATQFFQADDPSIN